ncbi:alkaline phosphatase, tissue-nonspecific isozyme [Aplochiton taeniatus]
MGISTITSTRILRGQLAGGLGEEYTLNMDKFPYTGLTKTYCVDAQVADSSCTATAFLSGVKTNRFLGGLSAKAVSEQCNTTMGNEVTSVLRWAKDAGKSVGLVTTTRVQHATPSASYAHCVSRWWYADVNMSPEARAQGCKDLAYQLVHNIPDMEVILGGGRVHMTPAGTPDAQYPNVTKYQGTRLDGINLIDKWRALKNGKNATYVYNQAELKRIDPDRTDYLLGLFAPFDMSFDLLRDPSVEPSLPDMVETAIRILNKNPKGFFLLVEGGRIDHAHHSSLAKLALHDTILLDQALERAAGLTNESDTLTVLTADHGHTLTLGGDTDRGAAIFGFAPAVSDTDKMPYTSLIYGNGPGFSLNNNSRTNPREQATNSSGYVQQSAVPLASETHSGEDVPVFARGPWAHLFLGTNDNTYTAHAMAHAACLGRHANRLEEENPEFWRAQARASLQVVLNRKLNTNVAKNIMLFLGDGMGITTMTAARILKGQLQNETGEETVMTMDTFPHVGLAKTYSVDFQIPDSSSTATAYLCGVKTNLNTVGVGAAARNGICRSQRGQEVTSILKWAKDAGKSVGIVTTTRVQHATPASSYAHSASRKWYSDADMPASAKKEGCTDIASQLLSNTDIDVIIGGGRKYMTPKGTVDPEYPSDLTSRGKRQDGRDLIKEWHQMKVGKVARYVWNRTDFEAVDPDTTDYLMALFEPGDLRYELERDPAMDPSLTETTEKAVRILSKNPKGFFLLVEGGRIDQGHHASRASMALHETVALDNAVAKGLELTNEEETLTLVTADHSHSLSFNGYPFRGNSILGKSPLWGSDSLPYTTLMYGNGPGYKVVNNKRPDIRNVNTKSTDYVQLSAVPLSTETHGGEDVAVMARGPMAHLFDGIQEQNYIAHAMAYAACVGEDLRHCASTTPTNKPSATTADPSNASLPNRTGGVLGSMAALLLSLLLAALLH